MFYLDLAALLGMSVRRLLTEMDSREITLWKARDRISPLDHARRAEVSAGTIALMLAKPGTSTRASDFITDYAAAWKDKIGPVELTAQQVADKIDAFFGASDKWARSAK